MARPRPDRPLLPSVLDRLLDDEPELTREAPASGNQLLRELRDSVRRDLENLLNTRHRCLSWPEGLEELEHSVFDYGVPDLTGANLASKRRRLTFLRSIEAIIKRFEPRFKTVKVTPLEKEDPVDRTLRFRIDAVMYAEPVPESVVYDSLVEPVTRTFRVTL
jgi:type VI secretion system protein ImpF